MRAEIDRFLDKVEKEGSATGCWEWKGAKYRGGYGHFRRNVGGLWKMSKAHRYAYEHFVGPLPPNLLVCHSCDNPSCVNPEHLFLGTSRDNVRDMIKKGRATLPRNPKHNLLDFETAQKMREDYKNGMKQHEISDKYKHSRAQVCRVVNFKIWK